MNPDNQPILFFICVCTALFLLCFSRLQYVRSKGNKFFGIMCSCQVCTKILLFFANLLLFDSSVVPVICSVVFFSFSPLLLGQLLFVLDGLVLVPFHWISDPDKLSLLRINYI